MNIYTFIILSTLIIDFVLNLWADLLNMKTIRSDLPEEFKGIYSAEVYRKSQEYTRVYTRFGFFNSSLSLAVTLLFWFAGGFNFLDKIVLGWKLSPILTGLAYTGILMLFRTLFSLPFSIYATFVIEERFGFNKTMPTTFIADLLKVFALAVLLGGPLLAGLLAFFEYSANYAWIYCWIATSLFILFIHFIAPTWIMPLFNKFKPLEEDDLKKNIINYTRLVQFPISDVFIIDGSRRSIKSNAFFTGFGKKKRIALYDTLVEKHSIPELVAILAHEIGHYKKKHITYGMIINILHTGIMFFLLSVFISHEGLFKAFYMEQISIYAGFIFFGMLYSPIELLLSIFMNMYSRKNEYQADRFVSETIENPETIVNALKTLSVNNLSNLRPHPFYVFLNYSHPPILERIKKLRSLNV
jgi:STE24 endopeptidase